MSTSESPASAPAPSPPTYPLPTYVYKILPSPPPTPIPPTLPLSALDAQDGFIHLSTASQTPLTAALFFASAPELWLLKIDTRRTLAGGRAVFRWVAGLPGCPHLYAAGTDAAGYVVDDSGPEAGDSESKAGDPVPEAGDSDGTRARTRKWAELGSTNVVGSRAVKRAEGQTWEDAFRGARDEGWLVDE